jgi:hypothetical protein
VLLPIGLPVGRSFFKGPTGSPELFFGISLGGGFCRLDETEFACWVSSWRAPERCELVADMQARCADSISGIDSTLAALLDCGLLALVAESSGSDNVLTSLSNMRVIPRAFSVGQIDQSALVFELVVPISNSVIHMDAANYSAWTMFDGVTHLERVSSSVADKFNMSQQEAAGRIVQLVKAAIQANAIFLDRSPINPRGGPA